VNSTLAPEYTFHTFVIGSLNRFAHASAVAVAEAPGTAYNPLFIYGGPAQDRTHLLHAAGNYARQLYPSLKVRYVKAAEFGGELAIAAQDGEQNSFRNGYLDLDILLVDDIQDMQDTGNVQAEFFRVFTTLHNSSTQLVVSADCAPRPPGQHRGPPPHAVRAGPDRGDSHRGERAALAAPCTRFRLGQARSHGRSQPQPFGLREGRSRSAGGGAIFKPSRILAHAHYMVS